MNVYYTDKAYEYEYGDLISRIVGISNRSQFKEYFKSEELLRDQHEKTVIKITRNAANLFVKVWWDYGVIRLIKDCLKGGKRGVREARGLNLLVEKGFKTPTLIVYGAMKHNIVSGFSFAITEEIKNASTLDQILFRNNSRDVVKKASLALSKIHRQNLIYGDFNYENILIDDKNHCKYYFLDWLGVKQSKSQNRRYNDVANFIYEIETHLEYEYKDEITKIFLDEYIRLTGCKHNSKFRQNISDKIQRRKKY